MGEGGSPVDGFDRRSFLRAGVGVTASLLATSAAGATSLQSAPGTTGPLRVEWKRSIEVVEDAPWGYLYTVTPTPDGGYLAGGATGTGNSDGGDAVVIRVGADGTPRWHRRFGGDGIDWVVDSAVDGRGNYRFVGQTGGSDGRMLTVDGSGTRIDRLSYTFGDGGEAQFRSVDAHDGSLTVGGLHSPAGAETVDGIVVGNAGASGAGERGVTRISRTGDAPLQSVLGTAPDSWVAAGSRYGSGYDGSDGWIVGGDGGGIDSEMTLGGEDFVRLQPLIGVGDAGDRRFLVGGYTDDPSRWNGYLATLDLDERSVVTELSLGSSGTDQFYSLATYGDSPHGDDDYLAAGRVNSRPNRETPDRGGNPWLVALSASGEVRWGQFLGNAGSILDVVDVGGAYVVVGREWVGDRTRGWIAKLVPGPAGESPSVGFSRRFAPERGTGGYFTGVARKPDGEAVAVGAVDSESRTADFAWAASVDGSGTKRWTTEFGDSADRKDRLFDVVTRSEDEDYFALGQVRPEFAVDGYLQEIAPDGELGPSERFGTEGGHTFQSLIRDGNGRYVAGGAYNDGRDGDSESWDGRLAYAKADGTITAYSDRAVADADWVTDVAPTGTGSVVAVGGKNVLYADGWIFETDPDGERRWSSNIGGGGYNLLEAVVPAPDGGYLAVGHAESNGAGDHSGWVLRVDDEGTLEWELFLGSMGADSFYGVVPTGDGNFLAVGEYGASEPARTAGAGVRPPRRPARGDAWIAKVSPEGDLLGEQRFDREGRDSRLFDVVVAGADRYLGVGQSSSEGDDEGWVVEFTPDLRERPVAAFDPPADPAPGDEVTLDAGPSSDSNGSIVSYEWDVDGDGEFEATGETVTHTYATDRDVTVTLRVTDDDGMTDTATETLAVRYPAPYQSKLTLARRIDDNSVVPEIECELPEDFAGDADLTEPLVRDFRAAVEEGRIDAATAEAAIRRLRAAEGTASTGIARFGPGTPAGVDEDDGINVARQIAEAGSALVIRLTFVSTVSNWLSFVDGGDVLPESASRALDEIGRIATEKATTLVRIVFGAAGSLFVPYIMREFRSEAQDIFERIRQGIIDSAQAVQDEIQRVKDEIASDVEGALRSHVEFNDFTMTLEPVAQCPTPRDSVHDLAGRNASVFGVLGELTTRRLTPSEVVDDGLAGDTATGIEAARDYETLLDTALSNAVETVENARDYNERELDVLDVLVDALQERDDSIKNALDLIGGMVNLLGEYVHDLLSVDAFIDGLVVISGLFPVEGIRRVNAAAGASALRGRRISLAGMEVSTDE